MSQPRYLTAEEAAALLRVSLDTMYRLLGGGAIAGKRLGRKGNWRIEPAAVEAYLQTPRGPVLTAPAQDEKERAELTRRGIIRLAAAAVALESGERKS